MLVSSYDEAFSHKSSNESLGSVFVSSSEVRPRGTYVCGVTLSSFSCSIMPSVQKGLYRPRIVLQACKYITDRY